MNTIVPTPLWQREAKSARILIVDDNQANVQLLQALLDREGYTNVTGVTDPRDVIPLCEVNRYDLILLDIRMPHMNGFGVMAALKKADPGDYLPVLVLTAQTDRTTRIRALELGAKDFVNKPFDATEVMNRIANMLEVRLLYNERRRQKEILEDKVRERTAELAQRNRDLEDARLDVIRRLGRAGEFRDNETGMHVVRMSKYCERLALATGYDQEFSTRLLAASPMHDVGKIGIPDSILLKPGKLDPEECKIMETHVTIGADILDKNDAPLMRMAHSVALTHHEKWDGTGYPRKLKGEDIPIEGRIASLCDVFDALTSERPYKKAWPIEQALDLVRRESGAAFDPNLVAAFERVLPDILGLRTQYADGPEHDMDDYRARYDAALRSRGRASGP
ncbi:MAG: response regulator [Rhodospirillales bacterium]|nr:response regulator [Rhodospirillales bacterium]